MEKINYKDLKLASRKLKETSKITINGKDVIVKKYLTTSEKIEFIATVVAIVMEDYKFVNVQKQDIYTKICVMQYYTNIDFADDELKDVTNLYDTLVFSGLLDKVLATIGPKEYEYLTTTISLMIDSAKKYELSAAGITEQLLEQIKDLKLPEEGIEEMQKKIDSVKEQAKDPTVWNLVQPLLTKNN